MITEDTPYDELPEVYRLALVDRARVLGLASLDDDLPDLCHLPSPRPVTPDQLSDATGIADRRFHRLCRIAMLKLRAQADDLGLDLRDFINP